MTLWHVPGVGWHGAAGQPGASEYRALPAAEFDRRERVCAEAACAAIDRVMRANCNTNAPWAGLLMQAADDFKREIRRTA